MPAPKKNTSPFASAKDTHGTLPITVSTVPENDHLFGTANICHYIGVKESTLRHLRYVYDATHTDPIPVGLIGGTLACSRLLYSNWHARRVAEAIRNHRKKKR